MRTTTGFAAGLLAAVATTVALAGAERATFILTDGERISGTVVFHTEARTNIREDKNEFNVGLLDGTEVPIPFHQVALIDFVGGQPAERELAAIPDSGQSLVMRSGVVHDGSLVDLIGGDTVRWRHPNADTEDFPIRQARRIYLAPDRARTIFAFHEDVTPARPAGDAIVAGELNVPAMRAWTETGLTVRRGQLLRFDASGQIRFGEGGEYLADPGGNPDLRKASYPVPELPVGALIGRIGNGEPFAIGAHKSAIPMPASGELRLGVNDDYLADNGGAFRVTILDTTVADMPMDRARNRRSPVAGGTATDGWTTVPGTEAWVDTGLVVRRGEQVQFQASGSVAHRANDWTDADGDASVRSRSYPVPGQPAGMLIARIDEGQPFVIGAGTETVTMPATGRLQLGVNDDHHADNGGAFRVAIRRDASASSGTSAGRTLSVPADAPWTDTGLSVRRGEVWSVEADGVISFRRGAGNVAGPAGKTAVRNRRYPVVMLPAGGLIGRIGDGEPFAIGDAATVVMPATGRLFLGINDDDLRDNSGSFRVRLERGGVQP